MAKHGFTKTLANTTHIPTEIHIMFATRHVKVWFATFESFFVDNDNKNWHLWKLATLRQNNKGN